MRIKVYNNFTDISEKDWNNLTQRRSVYQEYEWYSTLPLIGQLRLIAVYHREQLEALLPLYVLDQPNYYYHTPRDILCGYHEEKLFDSYSASSCFFDENRERFNWFPALVSVSPFGFRGGLLVSQNSSYSNFEIGTQVTKAIEELCWKENIRIAMHFYLNVEDDLMWMHILSRQGAYISLLGGDCSLSLHWETLDEYFSSLGKRERIERIFYNRMKQRLDVTWKLLNNFTDKIDNRISESASQLFYNAYKKHDRVIPPFPVFEYLIKYWKGEIWLLIGQRNSDETLRSAGLVFLKEDVIYTKFFGTDQVRDDYFFLAYHFLIEHAINHKIKRIEYGGGSHRAKLHRGALLRPLFGAITIYDSVLKEKLLRYLPLYEKIKLRYFSELAEKYQRAYPTFDYPESVKQFKKDIS